MALLRFFKPPPHQRYVYKPRFWDPNKEELQERMDRASGQNQGDAETIKSRISDHFSRRASRGSVDSGFRERQVARSNFRLILVLAAVILLAYLVLTSIPDFFALFE
jgi:hypothetical protein